ncbi:MAG TPA: 4-alpha-glucanotransferase [Terracidiphilus sp.]|nr:4-alpha-glucanotransferase [Terracidiphilus sp.]
MNFKRAHGVLLHVSSLASQGGIGDLGPAAHAFVEFLAAAGQHVWQVLPMCPTGFGNSPYAGSSAFAGNPFLISLEVLAEWGWIAREQIARERIAELAGADGAVNFDRVEREKLPVLEEAAENFLERGAENAAQWAEFEAFCAAERGWLNDYALYAVLRRKLGTGAWTQWPEDLRFRRAEALERVKAEDEHALAVEQALQFAFRKQWGALREHAARHGIRTMGDVPIFVNMDSADVWMHPEIFELDAALQLLRVAGVPPDYFSASGQRWGNPLYRWDVLRARGYDWWVERIRAACARYDMVRLDHFRGFEAYWAIPAAEETAVNGAWVKGPGAELFHALEAALGPLALVAEDLGVITEEVDALRRGLKMAGMKVIQFGFSDKGAHTHLPQQYEAGTVAYTGTHDNDTTMGWWRTAGKPVHAAVEALVGPVHGHPVWPLMRAVAASVAAVAIVPAQDLLELGSEARMNTPAVAEGNWSWRAPEGCWAGERGAELAAKLAALAAVTDRENDPLG